MELKSARNIVKIEGENVETTEFSIKFNSKLVRILSDGLYQDKILAIVRELSANAWDSHKLNGNQSTPIEVKLPTYFDKVFYIRDFGVGLSPEEIKEVYSVYGISSKEDSNDYIGALGLGSKTPFCYNTKTATIESFHDGKHYIYSAYINENGLPNITLLSTADTIEPTGLKITISVDSNDIYNFINAAQKVYIWWETKPNFVATGSQPNIPVIKYTLDSKTNNWALRTEDYHLTGMYAVMGTIAYPIKFQDSSLKREYVELMNSPINIFFDIGDLDIAASREGLSYDTRTKANIIARIKKIVDELNKQVESEVDKSASLFEARKAIGSILSKLPSQKLRSCIQVDKLKYNGKELFTKGTYGVHDLIMYVPSTINSRRIEKNHRGTISVRSSSGFSFYQRFVFIEADLKNGNQTRAKEYIDANSNYAYVLLLTFPDKQTKIDFLDKIGGSQSDLILASSLPKPSPVSRATGGGVKGTSTKIMEYQTGISYGAVSLFWKTTSKNLKKDSGIFVEFNRFYFRTNYGGVKSNTPQYLDNIIKNLNIIGKANNKSFKDITTVYGIKSAIIPKADAKLWTNLFTIVDEEVKKLANDNDFLTAREIGVTDIGGWDANLRRYLPSLDMLTSLHKNVNDNNHPFCQSIKKILEYNTFYEKYSATIEAFNYLLNWVENPPVIMPKKVEKPTQVVDKVYKKYPLLRHIDYDSLAASSGMKNVAEYLHKMEA